MLLDETVNKLLRDSINLILGSPGFAIKAKQKNAPRPSGKQAYADVDFMTDTSIGWEESVLTNRVSEDLDETLSGPRELMYSIGFYRSGARDNARKVRTALTRESVRSMFRIGKIGIKSRSAVRDLSESLKEGWEERAQFDIVLNAVGSDVDIITAINSVDISGKFQSSGTETNFTIGVN